MAEAVYVLCMATSIACAVLLLRAYARSRARFLLWSGLCFAFLAVNNLLLYVDLSLTPAKVDLRIYRHATSLVGLLLLLYGLIWDTE
jgi:hypothetical protein